MPVYGKRRKGKQGGRTTGATTTSSASTTTPLASADEPEASSTNNTSIASTALVEANPVTDSQPPADTTTDNAAVTLAICNNGNGDDVEPTQPDPLLVLTSEKRRGVYECDYCHADISQLPRIRCAVCPDFDLCLSCFATVDHKQALQRLKAQATAHFQAVGSTSNSSSIGGGFLSESASAGTVGVSGCTVVGASGVSAAALGHDDSHGYRVCDSTRYPLFPTQRNLTLKGVVQSMEDKWLLSSEGAVTGGGPDKNNDRTNKDDTEDAMEVDDLSSTNLQEESIDMTDKLVEAAATAEPEKAASVAAESNAGASAKSEDEGPANEGTAIERFVLHDDPRSVWTVEEDLRLLDGIRTHGLGNWNDISDAVSGHGSTGKTPKRCMERYLDDFLGRYGHILPPYTLLEQEDTSHVNMSNNAEPADDDKETAAAAAVAEGASGDVTTDTTEIRASKRRAVLLRSPSSVSNLSIATRKKFKAVPTESLPEYNQVWPYPYLPEGVSMGQEVGREQTYKAEQAFVKMLSQLENQEQVEELRRDWSETKLLKPGGPTVLPMRPEDVATMPGAELAGFLPRRGDFDIEWDNEAEQIIADMEFLPLEPAQDRELKLKVLAIYNAKLEEREKRKRFVLSRKLYDYRTIQIEEQKLPKDERDLIHRMRLFERFHTPAEHKQFIADLLKAKRLRKEIAKLQMYRRIGIRTLAEAEMYELDKSRRAFHKATQHQKATEAQKASETAGAASGVTEVSTVTKVSDETVSSSLWKQYRTTDRKFRRSIARGSSGVEGSDAAAAAAPTTEATPAKASEAKDESTDVKDLTKPETQTQDGTVVFENAMAEESAMDVDAAQEMTADAVMGSQDEPSSKPPPMDDDGLCIMPGYHLLSPREVDLCRKLQLTPQQYQEIKRALLQESLTQGLLDKDSSSSKRSVVMIDAERRGDVIDFMVRAGWISTKFAKGAR